MLPDKVKTLIDTYCMGIMPSDTQLDEIFNLVGILGADSDEVSAYMKEMINGPTKAEREEMARKEKEEAELKAERKAKKRRIAWVIISLFLLGVAVGGIIYYNNVVVSQNSQHDVKKNVVKKTVVKKNVVKNTVVVKQPSKKDTSRFKKVLPLN